VTVAFTLPAGSFATVLLGELMKRLPTEQAEETEEAPAEIDPAVAD
jgi:tRNA(Glu) U13 pseudouridine synthase TruD